MSLRGLLRRVLVDLVDPAALVVAIVITFIVNYFVFPPLLDVLASSFAEYIVSGSLAAAVYTFFVGLSNPITFLSFVLTLLFSSYLLAFIISRYWQKRTGSVGNPFRRAFERIVHIILAGLFISSVPILLFLLYLLYYLIPPWNSVWFGLFLLSLLLWVPFTLPVLASVVVEDGRGRDLVYEGLLAGRIFWWKNLLTLFLVSLIVYLLVYLLSGVSVEASNLLSSVLQTLLIGAVATESYYGFKHGE